ncbi:hypothetical protein [Aeromonas sobria]|uniref:hypothetical protein n=1 Tax=Aeromonas sobria TaxID=646 RepID=UPI001119BA3D|nr:hypothetical protein [Aeromonas sobria]
MRIGLFLLLFPSLALAIGGCPVGVQLGSVTMATRLPVCLKFDGSEFGGCLVDCRGVCVELPLANTKGPVETTGTSCNYSDNGSGNGDSDGSGNTPDEGASGTKPINGWLDFEPVIGDATGTSVSGAVAKLNKNLGVALRQVVDSVSHDTSNLNLIAHSAESLARDMKASIFRLDRMSDDISYTKTSTDAVLGGVYKTNEHLQSIISKMDSSGDSGNAGTGSTIDQKLLFENLVSIRGNLSTSNEKLNQLNSVYSAINNLNQPTYQTAHFTKKISDTLDKMSSSSGSDSGGSSIDYSKMPGAEDNPMSVKSSSYKSACAGEDCFFDVAAMEKKLADANKAVSDKHAEIAEEVKEIFDFSLSGSAGPMECFDLFSYGGKDYKVCPSAKDFWQTLAGLMLFIFYFIALMIIFKR